MQLSSVLSSLAKQLGGKGAGYLTFDTRPPNDRAQAWHVGLTSFAGTNAAAGIASVLACFLEPSRVVRFMQAVWHGRLASKAVAGWVHRDESCNPGTGITVAGGHLAAWQCVVAGRVVRCLEHLVT